MLPIEYQNIFNIDDCKNNRDKLYVFGDNFKRSGKKGQAVIRDLPNTIGIATKKYPSMSEDAFFTKGISIKYVVNDIAEVFRKFAEGSYKSIVLPRDGIGTGLAQLPKRAPHILKIINKVFYNESID